MINEQLWEAIDELQDLEDLSPEAVLEKLDELLSSFDCSDEEVSTYIIQHYGV